MSLNKAMIIGNLGRGPELRYTQSGSAVCNLNIATSEKFKDKSGEWQERTEWHRVTVWGRQAENCEKYLAKGSQVYVEGRIQTREWQDKDGVTKCTTEIIAQTVQFLKGGSGGGGSASHSGPAPTTSSFDQSFSDDDIPF